MPLGSTLILEKLEASSDLQESRRIFRQKQRIEAIRLGQDEKLWKNTVICRSFQEGQSSVDHKSNANVTANVCYLSRYGQTVLSFCIFQGGIL